MGESEGAGIEKDLQAELKLGMPEAQKRCKIRISQTNKNSIRTSKYEEPKFQRGPKKTGRCKSDP